MRAFLLIGLLCFVCGCSTVSYSGRPGQAVESSPVVTAVVRDQADAASWDFGTVKEGPVYSHEFLLRNSGDKELQIQSTTTSCGCTVPSISDKVIAPGRQTSIKVEFNSKGYKGKVTQFVYVNTDNEQNPVLRFTINANVE